jgi:hypothetical protein
VSRADNPRPDNPPFAAGTGYILTPDCVAHLAAEEGYCRRHGRAMLPFEDVNTGLVREPLESRWRALESAHPSRTSVNGSCCSERLLLQ